MNPLSFVLVIIICVLTLLVPKRLVWVFVLTGVVYLHQSQQFDVFGFHFTGIRIVLLVAVLSLTFRGYRPTLALNEVDRIVLWYVVASFVTHNVLWQTQAELVYWMGITYDILLSYFAFRLSFQSIDDVIMLPRFLCILILPLALSMFVEKVFLYNVFSWIGGAALPLIEEGRVRSMGCFRHPILAGTFGATILPIAIGYWFKDRIVALIGVGGAVCVIVTSRSSGPLMAGLIGALAMTLWQFRYKMWLIRRTLVALIVALHIYMKDPVWFLLARLSDLVGGDGWYRSYLIDRAIYYFGDWWLLGTKVTVHWMPTGLTIEESADFTSQYVWTAVKGGLLPLVLFICLIVKVFRTIGETVTRQSCFSQDEGRLIWGIGCSVAVHTISFISVSYFDQSVVLWYLAVAIGGTLAATMVTERLSATLRTPDSACKVNFRKTQQVW